MKKRRGIIFRGVFSVQAEEPARVFGAYPGHLLRGKALYLGYLLHDIAQLAGVVPLASEGDGREIGAVRLDEYALRRAEVQDLQLSLIHI